MPGLNLFARHGRAIRTGAVVPAGGQRIRIYGKRVWGRRQKVKAGYPIPEAQVLFERLDKKVAEEETEKLENPKFNEVQNIHGRNRLLDELARKGGWSIKIKIKI